MLSLYDPIVHRPLLHQVGFDTKLSVQGALGLVLFCLGFPDQALAYSNATIAEARRLAHPPSLANSLAFGTNLLSFIGGHVALQELSDELVVMTTEHDYPHWRAQGTIYRGWAKVEKGDVTEGIALLHIGSTDYRAIGPKARLTFLSRPPGSSVWDRRAG